MLVITTPTGQIGHRLLTNLLDSGESLRVVLRDPARLPGHVRDRVEARAGSHGDGAVIDAALQGADALFWVVPPDFTIADVDSYYLGFTRPAAEAIARHGVRHVVAVSTLGRDRDAHAGHLSAALKMDALLEATGASYRSLRMPFFMENLLSQAQRIAAEGAFALANDGDRRLPLVATRDIAAAATRLLVERSWAGRDSVPVVSPDNLTPSSMATVIAEALGRAVRFEHLDPADYRALLESHGASDGAAQALLDMAAAQNRGFYETEPPDAVSAGSTSLRAWCEETLEPAMAGQAVPSSPPH